MNLRGINPLELHAEKIFFGLMALVLLGVLALQFVGGGNEIKVDKDSGVPIDQAYAKVAQRAEAQLGRIRDTAVDPQANQPLADELAAFSASLTAPAPASGLALSVPLGPGKPGSVGESAIPSGPDAIEVALPRLPAPSKPLANAFAVTLDPVLVESTPELALIAPSLSKQQPRDVRAVTVESTFDAGQLVASLKADPDAAGPQRAIPEVWWQSLLYILDVQLWRQEVRADGSVGPEELVKSLPVPGAPDKHTTMRELLENVSEPRQMRTEVARIAQEQSRELIRPAFYRIIAGDAWTPPSMANQISQEKANANALVKSYKETVAELDRVNKELTAPKPGTTPPGKTPANQTPKPAGTRGGSGGSFGLIGAGSSGVGSSFGFGGSSGLSGLSGLGATRGAPKVLAQGGRPGGGGGGLRTGRPPTKPGTAANPTDDPEKQRHDNLEKRKKALEAKRDEIKAKLTAMGVNVEGDKTDNPVQVLLDEPGKSLKEGGLVRVWAHDVTVNPGATYRYKVRLVIPNPLFGVGPNLADDCRALSTQPVLVTPDSPWSDDVNVDPEAFLFVTDARRGPAGIGAAASANAVATAELFQFYYGFWRSDIINLAPGDAVSGALKLPHALPIFKLESDAANHPVVTSQSETDTSVPVAADGWFLLDVSPGFAGDPQRSDAVLRDPEGRVVVRDPRKDSQDSRIARLRQSADRAASAVVQAPGGGSGSSTDQPATSERPSGGELSGDKSQDGRPAPKAPSKGLTGGGD